MKRVSRAMNFVRRACSMKNMVPALAGLFAATAPAAAQYSVNVSPNCVFELHSSRGTVSVPACARPCCLSLDCRPITVELSTPLLRGLEFPPVVLIDREPGGTATESFQVRNVSGSLASLHTVLTATFRTRDGTIVGTDSIGLTLKPGGMLDDMTLSPTTVLGGTLSEGTITLQCEPDDLRGWSVQLDSDNAAAQPVDTVVIVPLGQTSATFLITTVPVLTPTDVMISATSLGVTRERTLRILPGSLDLSIRKVEVTQGMQYLDDTFGHADNSLPLVRGKPSAVRVYLSSNTPFMTTLIPVGLTSRSLSDPPDAWIEHAPLWPFARIRSTTTALEQRESPKNAAELAAQPFNATFLIDPQFVADGSRIFRAEVNPDHLIVESSFANNVHLTAPIMFRSTRNLNVKFVKIDWCPNCPLDHSPQHKPRWDRIYPLLPFAGKIFPVDNVNHWKAQSEVNVTSLTPHNFRKDGAWGYVLTSLAAMKAFTDDQADHMHYYGLLDDDVPKGNTCGMAWLPPDPTVAMGAWDCGGTTFAHEIGHNLGRKHAPCGGPDDPDGGWPETSNPNTIIGHTGFDLESGFALESGLAPGVNEYFDLMSYCDPEWISPYTYEAVYEQFNTVAASQTPTAPTGVLIDHVVVRGVFDDEEAFFLPPIYRRMLPAGTNDQEGIGTHSIVMRAKDGRVLRTRRYIPELADAVAGTAFFEILPFEAEASQIDFMVPGPNGEEPVDSCLVSAHSPTVQILQPNGGESLGATGTFTARWIASDPDNDPLFYLVQYSRDGGTTWESLTLDLTEPEFTLELADLAGSDNALLRVIASDGVNNGEDQSDAGFGVARKAPEVAILAPLDRLLLPTASGVLLRGTGTDPEDGPLDNLSFSWRSQRDGELGVGAELPVNLSTGVHIITLSGLDSDAQTATSSISVAVGTVGDCDGDGSVTLSDIASAIPCVSGPGEGLPSPPCACADLDANGHVDLFDMAYFQVVFVAAP